MKRIEMFSAVCLDTSCYSTWNYFSQGSCHITHKVPIEQQHRSSSTEPVQCTHKEGIIFIFLPCQNHIYLGTTRGKWFSGRLGWFFFLFWLLHWHCTSISCGPRHTTQPFQQKELQGECLLSGYSCTALPILSLPVWILPVPFFQDRNRRMEILSRPCQACRGQATPATGYACVILRQVS